MISRTRRRGLAFVVVAFAAVSACTTGSDGNATDSADDETATTELDVATTDDPGDDANDGDGAGAGDDANDAAAEPDDADSEPAADADDADDDDAPAVLVIDGPAQVDLDDSADQDTESAGDGETGGTDCAELPRGVSDLTIDAGGGVHDVRVFVPQTLASEPAPVVLNWHGLGSNGPEQAAFSGYETLAEQEGFVVVHPTGLQAGPDQPTSWELAQSDLPNRDDLAFADALIDLMVAEWCGDALRIYSTGMSNGGFFTAELVCNRADRIAAGVSVAGVSHAESCAPSRPVPYVAFHGTDDDVVPFAGGTSTLGDSEFFQQVMPDEFAEFAAEAGCDAEPVRTEETPEVVRYDYAGCDTGVPMTFYELPGSGHTWPNSPLADELAGLGVFTDDIDATVDGWAFLSQHSL